jgi:hypothetical protein
LLWVRFLANVREVGIGWSRVFGLLLLRFGAAAPWFRAWRRCFERIDLDCHTLGFAFCALLVRTVWVVGVLDGMSSRLNQFGLPSGCLNTAGMALALCKNTIMMSYM